MIKEKVMAALSGIRPALQADGGDIDLIDVSPDGIVKVRLTGACCGCPMSQVTLTRGVEDRLKSSVPEVKKVVAVE
jgi:Fe-S cluster biogenesis protein NfuA